MSSDVNADVSRAEEVPVTIVVPVYRGLDQVRACVESVLRHTDGTRPAELLLIDDASPDPGMAEMLDGWSDDIGPIPVRVRHNDRNTGFVGTVNAGLQAAAGDVVILNSDTVVTAGWFDRLARTAGGADVATVTPLTNEGSICTLPTDLRELFGLDGPTPDIDGAAAFIASRSPHRTPRVIAGVGFCMYVTRRALDACGILDEAAFSPGYGEEVDFCLRATAAGFVHLVEDATFVYHEGGVSFGDDQSALLARSRQIIRERYPTFKADNARERLRDPLRFSFAALREARFDRDPSRLHVLHLLHAPSRFGGTEKYLDAVIRALGPSTDFSVLHPHRDGFLLQTHFGRPDGSTRTQAYLLPADRALAAALSMFPPDVVHIQNLIGHPLGSLDELRNGRVGVIASIHDLYLGCPHHWLLFRNEVACGIPDDLEVCARCLPVVNGRDVAGLLAFRAEVADEVDLVDVWVAPSQSAIDTLARVHDLENAVTRVIPHGSVIDTGPPQRPLDEDRVLHEPLRIAFVGRGWTKKGLRVADQLAVDLHDSSIEVHHFGELREPVSDSLICHGPYVNLELPRLLRRLGVQIVLVPGPYAETFGFVLTEAHIAGLPAIGPSYGAVADRIRATGTGWTVDPHDADAIRTLVERLDQCRYEILRATRLAATTPVESMSDVALVYGALYREAAPDPIPSGALL